MKSRHLFQPAIECLEDRIALANDVQTAFVNGTLTITTVDQLDEVAILNLDNDQSFEIAGTGPGSVSVNQTGNTTIDGVATKSFTGVTNIVVKLKSGNDSLGCKILDISGDLAINAGEGDNSVNVDAGVGATKVHNLSIIDGEGFDMVTIGGATSTFSGDVTLRTGNGGCTINVGFLNTDDVTISGALKIINGSGAGNNVNVNGDVVAIDGAVVLRGGNTGNNFNVNVVNSITVGGATTVNNGSGNDAFNINANVQSATFRAITINNGVGNGTTQFLASGGTSIQGDLIVNNLAGNDKLAVDGNFEVLGKVRISNGNGDTTTDLSSSGQHRVSGPFTLINGAGTDNTTISGASIIYQAVKIVNGAGDSSLNIQAISAAFGSITSTSTNGADIFTVGVGGSFDVQGGVTLRNGNGPSTTTLGSQGTATIAGAFRVINADGADTLTMGTSFGAFHLKDVKIVNGAGDSTTAFNSASLDVTGSITVVAADGADSLNLGGGSLANFDISGSVNLRGGIGAAIFLSNPTAGGTIGGALTVVGTEGDDIVTLKRTEVVGATLLNLAGGGNGVAIDDSILRALTINTGAGFDEILIEANSDTGVNTTVSGAMKISVGAGADIVTLGKDANDSLSTTKGVRIDGGSGIDLLDQTGASNSAAISPVFLGFEVQLP